jgi:hypothetical protein
MKVLVKNTLDSRIAMFKANVPDFIVGRIIGRFVDYDKSTRTISVKWNGRATSWALPQECLEFSPD